MARLYDSAVIARVYHCGLLSKNALPNTTNEL